jgi:antitoxin (DNA-binding transcriptional repressor) of toxin-antitoxin stability system
MKKLTIREARQSLTHLDSLLKTEEEVLITRRGRTIARVHSAEPTRKMPSHADLRDKMPRVRISSADLLRDERDAR